MRFQLTVILFLLFIPSSIAQEIGSWSLFNSTRTVTNILVDTDSNLWISSTGGVEFYINQKLEQTFSTLDGLSRLDGRTSIIDPISNKYFLGHIDGNIDVINIETNEIHSISDISRFTSFTEKGINDFELYEGKLYVATGFGIVVYDTITELVLDSYSTLGDVSTGIAVNDIILRNDTLYAATNEGISYGLLTKELTISENWDNFNSTNGFTDNAVQTILLTLDNKLLASTSTDNYIYDFQNWAKNLQFGNNIISEYMYSDQMQAAITGRFLYYGSDFEILKDLGTNISSITFNSDSSIFYFASFNQGTGVYNTIDNSIHFITSDGPYQNFFSSLQFDNGLLIAASTNESARNGLIDNGKGYYLFDGFNWKNFNAQNNEVLRSFGFQQSFTTTITNDYYYFGAWGRGIARHSKTTNEITVFDETNSVIRGWEDDNPLFPVISGIGTDSKDDVWIVSRYADNPLYAQTPGDDEWLAFSKNSASGSDEYVGLFIDSNDQKWVTLENSTVNGTGILVIDTGNKEDESDDKAIRLSTDESNGALPDNKVNAIIEDKNGEIWVGTARGIARFLFPQFIVSTTNPSERKSQWLINEDTSAISRFLLRDVNVSSIAINSDNEKWIGSVNQGLWLLNAEGSRIEKRLTTENSPLLSNNIRSIAVNDKTGEVFIATDLGLMSFQDVAKAPVSKMKNLKVYPNPFSYEKHSAVIIEGLIEETTVRVLGVDGTVVKELETYGGRVSWDGLDYNGSKLGTGVYFVVSIQNDSNEKGIGKVVIVR